MARKIEKPPVSFSVDDTRDSSKAFWDWYESQAWEPDAVQAFNALIKPQTRYLDLGGYIGPTVLYAAKLAAQAYVVEPNPVNRATLEANIALNPDIAAKTKVYGFAVSDKNGKLKISLRQSESSLFRRLGDDNEVEVDVVGINDLLARDGIGESDFIKIDVEGAEYFLVPAMEEFIRRRRPTLLLATHGGYLLDRRSFWTRLRTSFGMMRKNRLLARVLMTYKHHYWFDEKSGTFVDVRWKNGLRRWNPIPFKAGLVGTSVFTDADLPALIRGQASRG